MDIRNNYEIYGLQNVKNKYQLLLKLYSQENDN